MISGTPPTSPTLSGTPPPSTASFAPPGALAGPAPWSPKALAAISFFFTFLPAGIMYAINYERLGQPKKKLPAMLITVVAFLVFGVVVVATPDSGPFQYAFRGFHVAVAFFFLKSPQALPFYIDFLKSIKGFYNVGMMHFNEISWEPGACDQTSAQSDVTAQHVDMAARLRNLRAEEARLRTLFSKAGDVSDLLEVEQELSSVRGDIESSQAQLAYLDQQVSLSTLAISLSQPGPIVRPAFGASWGIADAITQGVQSAVAVVRALIIGSITLAPLAALILLAWGIARLVRRLRAKRIPADDDGAEDLPSAE